MLILIVVIPFSRFIPSQISHLISFSLSCISWTMQVFPCSLLCSQRVSVSVLIVLKSCSHWCLTLFLSAAMDNVEPLTFSQDFGSFRPQAFEGLIGRAGVCATTENHKFCLPGPHLRSQFTIKKASVWTLVNTERAGNWKRIVIKLFKSCWSWILTISHRPIISKQMVLFYSTSVLSVNSN